jgi:hypothetical protein
MLKSTAKALVRRSSHFYIHQTIVDVSMLRCFMDCLRAAMDAKLKCRYMYIDLHNVQWQLSNTMRKNNNFTKFRQPLESYFAF